MNETKGWSFESINNIDKPLTKLTKRRRQKTQINKIIDEKWNSTSTNEILSIIRGYFENVLSTKQNFLKRRNSNGQKTHEKMLNIPINKGNAN
jgi:hypothetical protein